VGSALRAGFVGTIISVVTIPGRPRRLDGVPYDAPGPVFHCRIGTLDRLAVFADERLADLVVAALRFYQASFVDVLAYCVMPDHVHIVVSLRSGDRSLSRWVGDLKRWTTLEARRVGCELRWQSGFFEHVVREYEDLRSIGFYVLANPVRAGLAEDWRRYRWCGSFVWESNDELS
jgi:REP element-mobilizing transposase RayT